MYSYEDRLRAVRLYIKLGKRVGLTIRQLGYPTKNALKSWHREYEQRLEIRRKPVFACRWPLDRWIFDGPADLPPALGSAPCASESGTESAMGEIRRSLAARSVRGRRAPSPQTKDLRIRDHHLLYCHGGHVGL